MPHDLSHLGFLGGQICRIITISTTSVIAADSLIGQAHNRTYQRDIEEDIAKNVRTIKQAVVINGGLSKPSKMPEYGYSIPANRCQVGGRLQEIRGSVCHRCYARTNRFTM